MSDLSTFPADGVRHLIVEQMARDAILEGSPTPAFIEAACQSAGEDTEPVFDLQGEVARISGVPMVRLSIPADTDVTVKSSWGNLRIQRLNGDVNLESVRGGLRLSELPGVVRVAQVDADLRAQGVADLRLMGSCNGDLRFDDGEHVTAESVAGDVRIRALATARFGRVRGDIWAEKVRGVLQVSRAEGDVRLTEIAGGVTLKAVAGDLRATGLTGGLSAGQINGDAALQAPYGAGESYSLSADGDVVLHLPEDADAQIAVQAGGRIRSDAPLAPAGDGSAVFATTLGRGTAHISLSSGGDLRIVQAGGDVHDRTRSEASYDPNQLSERIRQLVSASLAAAGISVPGEGGWSQKRGRSHPPKKQRPPRPPAAERPRPSSPPLEEQASVLRMLEEGKITPEEADLLLKALGA